MRQLPASSNQLPAPRLRSGPRPVKLGSGKVSVNFFGSITLATGGDLRLNNNAITDVSKITGMFGKWSIDENGKLVVQELEVEGDAKFRGKAKFGTPEQPRGITIYDQTTGDTFSSETASSTLPIPIFQPTSSDIATTTATSTSP